MEPVGKLLGANRALVLCAHTDDEFGCAGLIIRLVKAGTEVRYVALSRCEESVPEGLPKDVLVKECFDCTAALGLPPEAVEIKTYPVRHFPRFRQDILEDFVRINREYKPDLVITPSSSDMHQDHATVYAEGFRAFKHATLLGFECPQNVISFENSAFIKLTEEELEFKIRALRCYASQAHRNYYSHEFIRSMAIVRGVQCNADYAEAFEVVRLMV
jgi:LmbE family N-acetylglucosaminyl deacetylase